MWLCGVDAEGGGLDAATSRAGCGWVRVGKNGGVLEFSQSGQHSLSGEIDCLCRVRCILHAPSGHDAAHRPPSRARERAACLERTSSRLRGDIWSIYVRRQPGHGEPEVVLCLGTSPETRLERFLSQLVLDLCVLSALLLPRRSRGPGIRLTLNCSVAGEQALELVSGSQPIGGGPS